MCHNVRATGTDDRYLSLFAGGLPAFKSKLREPLLQQTTIQRAEPFRGVLQEQHEAKRVRVAARQAEREEEGLESNRERHL